MHKHKPAVTGGFYARCQCGQVMVYCVPRKGTVANAKRGYWRASHGTIARILAPYPWEVPAHG